MSLITLTTDFGHADWFAGAVKGVILTLAPATTIIDIAHGIEPGDIGAGAFALAAAHRYFPEGTIHMAVIDPGVGSARAAIAVETDNGIFLGPDNGVLSLALENEGVRSIRQLENPEFFLSPVSHTFHARDVFAPVAARLSRNSGIFEKLGPEQESYQKLDTRVARQEGARIFGTIIYIDRFGNAITNIPNHETEEDDDRVIAVGRAIFPLKPCYQGVASGHGVAVRGSAGFLEIAINGGNAAARHRLKTGSAATLRRVEARA